jgi:hypothetical protein
VGEVHFTWPLCSYRCTRDRPPDLKPLRHLLAVHPGWEAVAFRTEVQHNRPICREETLGMAWRLESLHASFPLTCGSVGVLRAVVEIAVLAVFHTRQELANRCPIAAQLIGDDHLGYIGEPLQQLPKKCLGSSFISATLHEDVEDIPVLVDGPPEVMPFPLMLRKTSSKCHLSPNLECRRRN